MRFKERRKFSLKNIVSLKRKHGFKDRRKISVKAIVSSKKDVVGQWDLKFEENLQKRNNS